MRFVLRRFQQLIFHAEAPLIAAAASAAAFAAAAAAALTSLRMPRWRRRTVFAASADTPLPFASELFSFRRNDAPLFADMPIFCSTSQPFIRSHERYRL